MAKNAKKRKKAEKSKTQLKKCIAKKSVRLPKGLNVTDSRVTTKTLVLINQINSNSEGPQTKNKIGLKDLLVKVNSLSSSVRIDGISGIAELIQAGHTSLLEDNLSLIVRRLAPLTNDNDFKVRAASSKALACLIKKVDQMKLCPLYAILNAHLCCGLSHIDDAIQRSSLKLLDDLLVSSPRLIEVNFTDILKNCLNQISLQTGVSRSRVLAASISDKITSLQLRKDVLSRIEQLLKIVLQDVTDGQELSLQEPQGLVQPASDFYLGLYVDPCLNGGVTVAIDDLLGSQVTKVSTKDAKTEMILAVIPLLLDTWSEVILSSTAAKKKRSPTTSLLSSDVIAILNTVSKTMRRILGHLQAVAHFSQEEPFPKDLAIKITKTLLSSFPYELFRRSGPLQDSQRDKKSLTPHLDQKEGQVYVKEINLNMVRIRLHLDTLTKFKKGRHEDSTWAKKYIDYITEDCRLLESSSLATLVAQVLLQLLSRHSCRSSSDKLDAILAHLVLAHCSNEYVNKLLYDLSVSPVHQSLQSVSRWVSLLPDVCISNRATRLQREALKQLLKQRRPELNMNESMNP